MVIGKNDAMSNLIDIYFEKKHTTDKYGENNHTYLSLYNVLFSRFREKKIKILEIGVYQGDSLNLWAEYFSNSIIYGIDCDLRQVNVPLYSNIHAIQANAYSYVTIQQLTQLGKFDIIIDDGSHVVGEQIFVVNNYLNLLKNDGILIIEDAACWIKSLKEKKRMLQLIMEQFPKDIQHCVYIDDRRYIKGNDHDVLIICDKNLL